MSVPYRLGHLTDLHMAPLPAVTLRDLLSRRVLGWMSWQRRRQRVHLRDVLDALARDLVAQGADHIVVTGDLVNLALSAEFAQGGRWLGELGRAEDVSFVPGNHDAYVPPRWEGAWAHVGPFMRGDGDDSPAERWATFPYLRRRGPLALVGVSSAVSNVPTWALGRIGRAQLGRLRQLLKDLRGTGCCRVILLHHPPASGMASYRRRLTDAAAFRAVLRETGADLVLCGHQHRFQFAQLDGPEGPIPVLGGPSASLRAEAGDRYGGYLLHRISKDETGWLIEVEGRRYDALLGRARHDFSRRVRHIRPGGRLVLEDAGAPAPASV